MKRVILAGLLGVLFTTAAHAESSSFSRLMALGQSVQCSFAKPDGSQSGTIYVSAGKLRGDMQVREGNTTYPMYMIRDAQKMYTWGGPMGENQGMIMPIGMGRSPMGGPQTANMDEEMDFTCQSWSADAGKFEPPSDVQFQDMAQLMGAYAAAAGQ